MDDTVDLLKIKIEKAKRELSPETVNAINSVDWKAAILTLREKKGYTFEQLGDLELETELLLAGLTNPDNYPMELVKRMGIGKEAANELAGTMNDLVFKRIRGELIKNSERKKGFASDMPSISGINLPEEKKIGIEETKVLSGDGIEIIDKPVLQADEMTLIEIPETAKKQEDMLGKTELGVSSRVLPAKTDVLKSEEVHPILAQKLSSPVQIPTIQTDHSLENITRSSTPSGVPLKPGTSLPNIATPKPQTPKVDPYREIPE